jgi:hypothetical protein
VQQQRYSYANRIAGGTYEFNGTRFKLPINDVSGEWQALLLLKLYITSAVGIRDLPQWGIAPRNSGSLARNLTTWVREVVVASGQEAKQPRVTMDQSVRFFNSNSLEMLRCRCLKA